MQASTFTLATPDGVSLFVYRWLPDAPPKAVVQIAHGLAEHAARYARLAEALTRAGYAVYANDHRGHGRTARTPAQLGLFAERDGWTKCVDDLWLLNRRIAADHPGLPIVLLGHSLGSFMTQDFICEHGEALAAAVLSASNGKPPPIAPIGLLLARLERLRLGPRGHSPLMQALFFGAFNKPFAPARTPFDWLSRDTAEVDKYIADPLCGFESAAQLYIDVLQGLRETAKPSRQARIPKTLPIYIFNGSRDPVSDNIEQLLDAYRAAGLKQVVHKVYADGRHESLNETNRDVVTRDLIAWLDGVIDRARQIPKNT
ncbi:MAG: alpha/beta hydrolase [Xanthobacteraceae bacterium]|jgi:alpha-beta hydrolase superfamily lysophospholipase